MAITDETFLQALTGGVEDRVVQDFKLFVAVPTPVEQVRGEVEAAVGAHLMGLSEVQTNSTEEHPPRDLSDLAKALGI